MANRQRAEARRKAQAKASRQAAKSEGGGGGNLLTWLGLGAAVVVAAVAVIVAFAGGDDSSDGSDTTNVYTNLPTSQPVSITGDALAPYEQAASPDPAIGVVAPVLEGKNFNGDTVTLDASKDGAYMVVFLAHWCPHCNAEMPLLRSWKQSGGVPDNLKVVGVATAVSASSPNFPPAQWFADKGWTWPVMVDESTGDGNGGKAAMAYGATGWPYFVIVGADGTVKARVSGEVSLTDLQSIVDGALAS